MTNACQYLHEALAGLPRLSREDLSRVPNNGIYVLFEKGETGHGVDRIVCVGTHNRQNNLAARIREHFDASNKDRSIFRKHIGRCLLAKRGDAFLDQWQRDLTTRAARATNEVDLDRLNQIENEVTRHIIGNFSFSVLRCDSKAVRLHCKKYILSTVYHCSYCAPSKTWLGKAHPNLTIVREGGLWNVQNLRGPELTLDEARKMIESGTQPA